MALQFHIPSFMLDFLLEVSVTLSPSWFHLAKQEHVITYLKSRHHHLAHPLQTSQPLYLPAMYWVMEVVQ